MMGRFIQGFLVSIILTSLLLGTQYGTYFNFLSDDGLTVIPTFGTALNWRTAIMVSLVFLIIDRNQGSYLIPVFAWCVFDTLWIYKHSIMGSYLFGSKILTFPTSRQLAIGYGRNIILLVISSKALRQMKKSIMGIIFFSITGLYWLYLIYPIFLLGPLHPRIYQVRPLLFNPIAYYAINFAPFIISFKEWTGKKWSQFLFC